MIYRELGATGLRVSILGYGASPLGGEFGPIDEEEGVRTVHAALDSGINYFDVAPYYGRTRAESVLGRALRTIPRESYILATKVGRYDRDQFDFSADRVTRSVEESLQRLGVETVDVIQCHDIEFGSLNQIIEETLPSLERLRQQGKVRFIGITGYPLHIFRYVLPRARVDTVLSYCRYTLCNTDLENLLPWFQQQKLGVVNASPLAMGLLTDAGPPPWHPAPAALKMAAARAAAFCHEQGKDLSELALQFALANPAIHVTLVGMADRKTLEKNLRCVGVMPDLQLLGKVRGFFQTVVTTWPSGRPENQDR
ncbi:predicted oxidoreductase, aryl-alcohol dehydrogenase like protein [Chthonomonas calidirosea]|uniref:aldo/keto reductase n=1 Tax=Chthonomonas calidirosea TaxID=454171 RepID=UPI0006DD4612|nr:aldo/keto reductase [Chthonomonas calidirosea]CEK16388.1 predicted oxidoreductase, aryl-alcohol dehydrogenase like protein [Chthonomonas calidirosea]